MKKVTFFVSVVCVSLFLLPMVASADLIYVTMATDLTSNRSTGNGLTGVGGWDGVSPDAQGVANTGFKLSWEITEASGVYTYSYWVTGATDDSLSKSLSHMILQVTDGAREIDFWRVSEEYNEGGIGTYSEGNDNPGLPSDIFGLKWNTLEESLTWGVSFLTLRAPVWGDFYAKDGNFFGTDTYVYNDGFGVDPSAVVGGFDKIDYIARPNGNTPVPEPATMLLFGTGLIGLAGLRLRKKNK